MAVKPGKVVLLFLSVINDVSNLVGYLVADELVKLRPSSIPKIT